MPDPTKPDESKLPPATANASDNRNGNETAISPPTLLPDGTLDLEQRSVRSVQQAMDICTSAEKNNTQRSYRTKQIQELHDMAPPRSLSANVQKAKAYADNFSTGFLAGVSQQVSIPVKTALASTPFLTFSMLPPLWPSAGKASGLLRAKFTDFCRDWQGFDAFSDNAINETILQGYAYSAFLSAEGWRPTFFKQDMAFVPEGSSFDVTEIQFLVLRMDYPVQKFLALIQDKEAATRAGYQFDNCEIAAANAVVANPAGDAQTTQPRKYADMVAEGTIGLTYAGTQPRQVETYLLLHVEYGGQISLWMLNRNLGNTKDGAGLPVEQRLLRYAFKAFKSFEEVAQIFSFESGNGCIFSSKGIGRRLGNMAVALELARNEWMTNGRLSSLLIIVANSLQQSRLNPTVVGPFMVVDKAFGEISQQRFQSNSDGLLAIDKMLTAFSQQAAGAYTGKILSPNDEDPNETATAKKIDTARENMSSAWLVTRIVNQIMGQVGAMQRRALSDANIDRGIALWKKLRADPTDLEPYSSFDTKEEKSAVSLVAEICQEWDTAVFPVNWDEKETKDGVMGTGLVKKTMQVWRDSPATPRSKTLETQRQQGLDAVAQQYGTNPSIDQNRLLQLRVENLIGPNLAQEVLIPNADQTVTVEAARWQEMETGAMFTLHLPVRVSPRDNHLVHAQTLQQGLMQYAGPFLSKNALTAEPPLLSAISLNVDHMGQHLAAMKTTGQASNPAFKALDKFYDTFKQQFTQMLQIREQAKVAEQVAVARHRAQMQASGQLGTLGQAGGVSATAQAGQPAPAPQAGQQGAGGGPASIPIKESVNINYKDLPPDVQQQVIASIGLQPSKMLEQQAATPAAPPMQPLPAISPAQ